MLAYRRVFSEPVAVDHLRGTDALARAEAESRAQRFQEEKERLEAELNDIRQKYTDLQTQFESRLDARVQELRDNPEKLRQLMLAVGRGQ